MHQARHTMDGVLFYTYQQVDALGEGDAYTISLYGQNMFWWTVDFQASKISERAEGY